MYIYTSFVNYYPRLSSKEVGVNLIYSDGIHVSVQDLDQQSVYRHFAH